MAYCAAGLKTESGDDYTILVEYRNISEVPEYLHEILDDELGYVYSVEIDTGVSPEEDEKISSLVYQKIENLKE